MSASDSSTLDPTYTPGTEILKAVGNGGPVFERSFPSTPTAQDLALIHGFTSEPIPAAELYQRRGYLCNDKIDDDGERFEPDFLEVLAETLPGKSLRLGHEKQSYGIGKWYRTKLARDVFNGIDALWLAGDVYLPKFGNEKTINDLRAGIASELSIGLQADGRAIRKDAKGKELYRTYIAKPKGQGRKARATEGSIVWLGAQPGAAFQKALAQRLSQPETLVYGAWGSRGITEVRRRELTSSLIDAGLAQRDELTAGVVRAAKELRLVPARFSAENLEDLTIEELRDLLQKLSETGEKDEPRGGAGATKADRSAGEAGNRWVATSALQF